MRIPCCDVAALLRGLAALLLGVVPGAILLCILHCSIPSHAHQHGGQGSSPFVCGHTLNAQAEIPPPLGASVVISLVQSLASPLGLAAVGTSLLYLLAGMASASPCGRPADAPPAPPPRPRPA